MVEAERDASLFRFLEAFLESIPQLLVQGFFAGHNFWIIYKGKNNYNEINVEGFSGGSNFLKKNAFF